MNIIKRIQKWWNQPLPIDPIRKGQKVKYLGQEWIVTKRVYCDTLTNTFEISRINPMGQLETAYPQYFSDLVTPIK